MADEELTLMTKSTLSSRLVPRAAAQFAGETVGGLQVSVLERIKVAGVAVLINALTVVLLEYTHW